MRVHKLQEPERSVLRKAVLLFVLVSAALIGADQLSLYFGLGRWQRFVDDVLGSLIAASIFHWYELHRLRRLVERLHVIDLMNHHIRNALQTLVLVSGEPAAKVRMQLVEDCVHYIDWALREVLPGHSGRLFVVHEGRSSGKTGVQVPSSGSRSFSADAPQPQDLSSEPAFTHWLDSWKSRNYGAGQ